jgi:hypothetical protein
MVRVHKRAGAVGLDPTGLTCAPAVRGLLTVLTGRHSRKAAAMRSAGRFSLCAQETRPPYRYVSVEGPVVGEEELDPAERLAMARRYLGAEGAAR